MDSILHTGTLIVFEGIDGTGKSTQLDLLSKFLQQQGLTVEATQEPTEGSYGRQIRQNFTNRTHITPEEELELFINDRKDHVTLVIKPGLSQGKIILCDRYYLSTIAYQGAAGFDLAMLEQLNDFAPRPDIALLFGLPPEKSVARITQARGDVLNDFEQLESLQKVAQIFQQMQYPFIRHVDALQSIDIVHQQVVHIVGSYLNSKQARS